MLGLLSMLVGFVAMPVVASELDQGAASAVVVRVDAQGAQVLAVDQLDRELVIQNPELAISGLQGQDITATQATPASELDEVSGTPNWRRHYWGFYYGYPYGYGYNNYYRSNYWCYGYYTYNYRHYNYYRGAYYYWYW